MVGDDFKEILNSYPVEKQKEYRGNDFAAKMRNEMTNSLSKLVEDIVGNLKDNPEKYYAKISPGQNDWTNFPWGGIRNIDGANNFKEGLYIVYLFDFELNGVFYL